MQKNLIKKTAFTLFLSSIALISIGSTSVRAATLNDTESKLDEILKSEEKIMMYDAKTGETTEVDMEKLKQEVNSSKKMKANSYSTEEYDPFANIYKSNIAFNMNPLAYGDGQNAVRILDTSEFPYRVTCRLEFKDANGKTGHGSGALVGPSLTLTAAHCVFNDQTKEKYLNWVCYPGYNENAYKGYSCGWSRVYYSSNWMNTTSKNTMRDYDWAICVLEQPLGDYLGWMGSQAYGSNSELNNTPVKMTGYPADTSLYFPGDGKWQYETGDKITSVSNNYFNFSAKTAGGFSGGPVRRTSDGRIVGIDHGYDIINRPDATRVSQEIINIILSNT